VKMTLRDARTLAIGALKGIDFDDAAAAVTADHLLDAALRGVTFGSLPRILAIAERIAATGDHRRAIRVIRETPVSALLDGGDQVGYVVAHRATRLAIDKAKTTGIAIVGAGNTYYTGLFSYYLEMATREGLVAFAAGNGPPIVAPEGAIDGRMGTNPIAFGFPSTGDPVIWDIGTCAIMHGELLLHQRLGEPLPEGVATDKDGVSTRDPAAALAGAIRSWGGHRGSGLGIVVQLLGALCDVPVMSPGMREMAYLVIVIDPKLLMPDGNYPERVSEFATAVRSARPTVPGRPVRMPFDRSVAERRRRLQDDAIEVPDRVHVALVELAARKH
jgi:delta1-piperideine-2-carboxylate reductase